MYLIQHGFQAGSKIADALAAGTAAGVIWSPGDELPTSLSGAVHAAESDADVQAIDPQVYVSALVGASSKKLPRYGFFEPNLQPGDFTSRKTLEIVTEALDLQEPLPVTDIIAPTVVVDSVTDRWAQVATNLAQASIEDWRGRDDDRDLLVSIACSRSLLANEEEVNALLDDVTALECDGFYVLCEVDPELGPPRYDDLLERSLWITHSLAELNDYRVWAPYAGLGGYVHRAAGAEAFAAGWWQKLRWWSPDHWTEGGGGRAPRPRVFLDATLSSLLVEELDAVYRADRALYADLVAGVGPVAADLRARRPRTVSVSRDETAAQLFAVCSELDSRVNGDFIARGRKLLDDLDDAGALYRRIRAHGIGLDPRSGSTHLASWRTAVEGIATRLDIVL